MALQKSLVHLNLTGGADGKGDDFLTDPSKLDLAQNVEFDDSNTVRTRGGQVKYTLPSGPATAVRMFAHRERPIIEFDNGKMHAANGSSLLNYVNSSESSFDTNAPLNRTRVGVITQRVCEVNTADQGDGVTDTRKASSFDIAYGSTTYAVLRLGVESRASMVLTIYNASGDAEVQTTAFAPTSNEYFKSPRIIYDSTNDRFALFWIVVDSTAPAHRVHGYYIAATGGTATDGGTLISLTKSVATPAQMDASVYSGQGYSVVAWDPAGGGVGTIRIRNFSLDLAPLHGTASLVPTAAPTALTAHSTYASTTLKGHAFWSVSGIQLYGAFATSAAAPTENTLVTTGPFGRLTAYTSGGVDYIVADSSIAAAGGTDYAVQYLWSVDPATHVATVKHGSSGIQTQCFLAGRQFSMRSRDYIPLFFASKNFQGQILVLDLTAVVESPSSNNLHIAARLGYGEVSYISDKAAGSALTSRLPGSHASCLPFVAYESNLRRAGGTNATSLALFRASFSTNEQLGDAEVNGVSFLAGAVPQLYDGHRVVEEGFHWGPELTTSTTTITPVAYSASLFSFPNTTNTYTVVFTVAWQDARGNWHESAPSAEYSISVTAGGAPGTCSIDPTLVLPPTQKRNLYVLMYRTLASSTDTSLYLAHTGSLECTPLVSYSFANDAKAEISDADLIYSEQLYTAGNVLPNTPAPPCRHVSVFQKRLVLSGCGDGSEVHWSKQSTPGYGVEFSAGDPTHQTTVPRKAGRVVATQEMDDRLWLVCENSVGVISGTGPDPTGTQGQYSDFSTAIAEIGASWDSPKSVVRGPEGIWFRSPFGIRLASRSGGLARGQSGQDLGAEVDDLVSGNLVATVGSSTQQIRFYQSSGSVLVWDYQFGQWSQFTGFANVDAVYAGGRHYHLSNVSTTPLLRYTSSTAYVDVNDAGTANSLFTSTVRTGWLSLAGIQGFQRAYRLMILGKSVGGEGAQAWDIAGTLYYDFVSSSGTETFSTTATPSGGVIQLQHHMAKQKCEAIKIQLTFTPDTSSMDYAFRITDLTLQVGLKPGYFKLPSAKRI